jgi:nucleotide-binding universal stress UspA family protein
MKKNGTGVDKVDKMFQKILVPLDGSKLAECALPYAEEIARGCKANCLVLVSVTERLSGRTSAPEIRAAYRATDRTDLSGAGPEVKVTFGKLEKQAQRYLDRWVKSLGARGISAQAEVLMGNPAQEIAAFAEENSVDLIVMSSHGRSGPSRWTHGSVAEKVFRASCVPILMVRAPGCII